MNESLLDQIKAIWGRRKWLAILCFVFPAAIALSVLTFLPGIYRSTATVLVERQQVPEAFVRPTVTSALETRLQTIAQEVLSRARLENVITRFRLYEDLKSRVSPEEVIDRMRSDIRIEYRGADTTGSGQRSTIAFAISYRGQNPFVVAQVTNTLASFFIEENLKVRGRQAAGTSEFLKAQLADVRKRLDEQEQRVSAFKKRNLSELPQQMEMNLGIIDRLDTQLRLNIDAQTRLAERRDTVEKRGTELASLARAGVRPPIVGDLRPIKDESLVQELTRMQRELRDLRTRYSEKYPDVVRLKASIAEVEAQLAEANGAPPKTADAKPRDESTGTSSPGSMPYAVQVRIAQEEIDAEVRALKAEERRIRGAIATYVARVQNAPKLEQEYKEVSRDYESTRELYATLSKRYEEAELAENMEQRQKGEQFRILDPAVPGNSPVAPQRLPLSLMGLAISAGFAAVVVIAVERIRPAFHSVDALRAFTAVPVLLSIPPIVTARDMMRRQRRMRLTAVCAAAALILVVGISYLIASGNEHLVSLMVRGRS